MSENEQHNIQPRPESRFRPPEVESAPRDRSLFRVSPIAYLMLGIFLLAMLGPLYYAPSWGWVFLVVPVGFAWWVARSWTRVDDAGVRISTWRSRTFVPWDEVKGLNFPKRGTAQLVTSKDKFLTLSSVGFNDLPRLAEVSKGRVPDPFYAPVDAADFDAAADAGSGAGGEGRSARAGDTE
ncbi:PH domain-containing protein [Dietzia sp.]|uniref:PH domain-containing protein n=1 Tax=Dietzia sp. TaxID=1871616 RepID=UPI002FD880DE